MDRNKAQAMASRAFGGQELAGDDWRRLAKCIGMSSRIFFPSMARDAAEARRVCRICPVQPDCLAFALSLPRNPPGVWGGTSKHQRSRLLRGDAVSV